MGVGVVSAETIPAFQDKRSDQAVFLLFDELGVTRNDCSSTVGIRFPDSILYCGKLPKRENDENHAALKTSMDKAMTPFATHANPWVEKKKSLKRTYLVDTMPVTALLKFKNRQIVVAYPLQIDTCEGQGYPTELIDRYMETWDQPNEERKVVVREKTDIPYAGPGHIEDAVLIEESKVHPEYPLEARKNRRQGLVLLGAVIDDEGNVADICLYKVSPMGYEFGKSAIQAAARWRYEPATRDGEPVDVYFSIKVDYTIH
ncbi:MAG: energy transducer TonB [Acidobacteriota bacterium]|nr:energy transducer TonB [Acidobacteriota bacterium]